MGLLSKMFSSNPDSGAINRQFIEAAEAGRFEECRRLIDKGADPLSRSKYGATALHWAAKFGDVEFARLMLDKGVPVDIGCGEDNNTPLNFCASASAGESKDLEMMEFLVGQGANVNARTGSGREGEPSVLHGAAMMGHLEMVKFLVNHGADVSARWHGETADETAEMQTTSGCAEICQYLREHRG